MPGFGVDRGSGSSSGATDSAIAAAVIDAKGDLIVGTAADTADRLAVGTDGQRLVAKSSTSTGLEWESDTTNYVVTTKGDIIVATANQTVTRLAAGTDHKRLIADSTQATGLNYIADTTNYAINAKGDLLAGTAANTVTPLTVGTDGTALLADSSQSTGLRWGSVPAATMRQTQLAGPVDSSGYNATLSAGAGLNFNVDATPTNVVFTFANGFGSGGSVDLYTQLTADASNQGSLNASNTHYITALYSSASAVTWGQTLVPPDYGYAFDRTRGALLNFEGANASTTMVDDFGNTWTAAGNAQITTAQSKFGTSSLVLDGSGDEVQTTNITTLGDGSWEMSLWFRINANPGVGTAYSLFYAKNAGAFGVSLQLVNTGGTIKLGVFLSSDGSTWNIANGTAGSNSTWTLSQWDKVRLVFDALAGTYKVYLSLNGAAETADISVSSTARINSITSLTVGSAGGSSYFNGWIDAFRFVRCATATSAETPSASAPTITDYPYHFFSIPSMTMYKVTAASASAGTNPTLTQENLLFVGECDTNGSTVTAVRNYALRGRYISADTAMPAAGTTTSFSHNIGTRVGVDIHAFMRIMTSATTGVVGDVLPLLADAGASNVAYPATKLTGRNTAVIQAGDQANPYLALTTAGVPTAVGAAVHKMFLDVRRAW